MGGDSVGDSAVGWPPAAESAPSVALLPPEALLANAGVNVEPARTGLGGTWDEEDVLSPSSAIRPATLDPVVAVQ